MPSHTVSRAAVIPPPIPLILLHSFQEYDPTQHSPSSAALMERRLCRWPELITLWAETSPGARTAEGGVFAREGGKEEGRRPGTLDELPSGGYCLIK